MFLGLFSLRHQREDVDAAEIAGQDVNVADLTALGLHPLRLESRQTPHTEVAGAYLYTVFIWKLKGPVLAFYIGNARQSFWRDLGLDGQRAAIFGLTASEIDFACGNIHARLPEVRNRQPNTNLCVRKL